MAWKEGDGEPIDKFSEHYPPSNGLHIEVNENISH